MRRPFNFGYGLLVLATKLWRSRMTPGAMTTSRRGNGSTREPSALELFAAGLLG